MMVSSATARLFAVVAMVVLGCGEGSAMARDAEGLAPTDAEVDRLLLVNGSIRTMDPVQPAADSLLVVGNRIAAVGSEADVRPMAEKDAVVIDLHGRTVLPGFIDSHSHRLTQRDKWGLDTIAAASAHALSEGWTSIQELAVWEHDLEALVEADAAGELRTRVDAYLAVNGFDGSPLDDWYHAFQPGQQLGPRLRVAGLKIFIDFDSGRTLLWEPDELVEFIRRRQQEGWQVSMKAIGQRSHALALEAIQRALDGASNEPYRYRLEHSMAVDDKQLALMARLGIVTAIQPSFPGVLWYSDDIRRLVVEEGRDNTFRWPEYLAAGLRVAASPYNPDPAHPQFTSSTHVSPMGLLYRSVTQVGLDERPPKPWMLSRSLTVDQLLPLMTIGGAYAAAVDQDRGSLAVGKLADLVVLSEDPSAVAANDLLEIDVLATIVDGVAEYVRPGVVGLASLPRHDVGRSAPDASPMAEVTNVATDAAVTASSSLSSAPASNVIDGTPDHWNAAGPPRQWVDLDLEHEIQLVGIRLVVAQDPPGRSVHRVLVAVEGRRLEHVATFRGVTADGDVLTWKPDAPMDGVERVRIVTTKMPDLDPAWREIEVLAGAD